MSNVLNEFLTFFNLTDIANMSADITVVQFLGLLTVAFIAFTFTCVTIKILMEMIKTIVDFRKYM